MKSSLFVLPNGNEQKMFKKISADLHVLLKTVVQCVPYDFTTKPSSPPLWQLYYNTIRGVGYSNGKNPTKLRQQTVILQSKLNSESNSMDRFDLFLRPAEEIN